MIQLRFAWHGTKCTLQVPSHVVYVVLIRVLLCHKAWAQAL